MMSELAVAVAAVGGLFDAVDPTRVPAAGRLVYLLGALIGVLDIALGLRARSWEADELPWLTYLSFTVIGCVFVIFGVGGLLGRTQQRWEIWTFGLFIALVLKVSVWWLVWHLQVLRRARNRAAGGST